MPLWQRMMRESTVSKVLQIWSFPHLFKGTLKDPEQHISYTEAQAHHASFEKSLKLNDVCLKSASNKKNTATTTDCNGLLAAAEARRASILKTHQSLLVRQQMNVAQ